MDVGGALTRKIGPLPAYAWGLLIVGSLWAYYLWSGHTVGGSVSQDTSSYPDDGGGISVSGQSGDVDGAPPPDLSGTTVRGPQSNLQWQALATTLLIGEGKQPGIVFNALTKFLQGAPLSPDEAAVRDRALQLLGLPPEGAEQSATVTPPPTPPAAKPAVPRAQPSDFLAPGFHRIGVLGRTYTMRSIAVRATRIEYRANATIVETVLRRIVATNPRLRGRTTIPGGTIVIIPPGKGTSS